VHLGTREPASPLIACHSIGEFLSFFVNLRLPICYTLYILPLCLSEKFISFILPDLHQIVLSSF